MYLDALTRDIIFSPSDLTTFAASPYAAWMDQLRLLHPDRAPQSDPADPLSMALARKGLRHEARQLSMFRDLGKQVVTIPDVSARRPESVAQARQMTRQAMKEGADVIFQALLEQRPFRGLADFLVKVPGISEFGEYQYEVWDTKLSSTVKPSHLLQLCCYADMLEAIQGVRSQSVVVALGSGELARFRTDDYFYYYQALKAAFIEARNGFDPDRAPDPADYASHGRWSTHAQQRLVELDHLGTVATMSRSQIKKLNKAGIKTRQQLIESSPDTVPGLQNEVLHRLRAQASLQQRSEGLPVPLFDLLPPHPERVGWGLSALPPHSPLDVFFDIEGYPLEQGGLEYLWGCTYFDECGERQFRDFWAHDAEQEKRAFVDFIDWVYERWLQDPGMHIYHYASYEITACRKLMGRYGIREHEVDQLLRNGVFVDLYAVVRTGLRVGEPRYSIKNIEHLYRPGRSTDVASGGDSVVAYEAWREANSAGLDGDTWQTSEILRSLRDYNRDDCNSTEELAQWLRARQQESGMVYEGMKEVREPEVSSEIQERVSLRDRLLQLAEVQRQAHPDRARVTENLAWMLEFHRRESKPVFWRLFDRLGQDHHELEDDIDCVANCVRTAREPFLPTSRARNHAYEYRFNPDQEFKPPRDDKAPFHVLGSQEQLKVTFLASASALDEGLIVVQCKADPGPVITLIPDEYVDPASIPGAIENVARAWADNLANVTLTPSAIVDFLLRASPRRGELTGQPLVTAEEPAQRLDQVIAAAESLESSYLAIQGPPGAGKSFTAARMIGALVSQGKRVGISSNSHKAINNLLLGVARYCQDTGIVAHCCCTRDTEPELADLGVACIKNAELHLHVQPGCVLGSTAWGFTRPDMAGTLDYLFVDEAGQVAVANLAGMSRSARNLILMGDQMQLGQPTQGTHPLESGASVLDYLLHDQPIIDPALGVFLDTTYRMHPAVNRFISQAIYEGELKAHPDNARQQIEVAVSCEEPLEEMSQLDSPRRADLAAGVMFVPVEHQGNTQASDEEVQTIARLASQLLGRAFTDKKGGVRALDWRDMLFVAPYNHQVGKLRQALGEQARVGSVDKFQGQEAPVVFFSLCCSDASEAPRGLEFLFDKHRLNVAISRAQALAIVVGQPALFRTPVSSVENMARVNVLARLV
ncbi:TM0106 family RecB-like putative nuclease [Orrella marina]|uniref:Helicase n=1 Tax=Orrella marina TaxID=2163011 RepID=A0A2R4XG16_9BURK|nr:TM0106 family RecB-like putative nuclease [Orrella marina]AWB32756.1 helicase [Orrella marina]